MTEAGRWMTELTSAVRLYGQGRITCDEVLALATHIWTTDGDPGEPQGAFVVRQLLVVAGQATVDEDQAVFDSARALIGGCPEADREAASAERILNAFATVKDEGATIRAVKDAHGRHFGP